MNTWSHVQLLVNQAQKFFYSLATAVLPCVHLQLLYTIRLILYHIQTAYEAFGNIGSTLFAYGNMVRYDPILVDLTSNFFFKFVICTNV